MGVATTIAGLGGCSLTGSTADSSDLLSGGFDDALPKILFQNGSDVVDEAAGAGKTSGTVGGLAAGADVGGVGVDSVVELLGKGASTLVEPGSVFSSALAWLGGVTGSVLASEFFDSESLELAVSLLDMLFFCCFWVCFDAFVFLGFALFCSASAPLLSLPNTLSHIVGEVSAACSGPEIMPKRTIPTKKSTK